MTLPDLAIKRPVTTLMVIVCLVVLGGVALTRLPLAFLPEIIEPELFINLPYSNASPEQIERMIVRPVEDAVGSVKGLKSLWSSCRRDGGNVRMEFDWKTDLHLARVEVWERIDRIRDQLPDDMGDITVGNSWNSRDSDSPIIEGRLSSPRNLSESYDLLERKIIKPLERVPGVAQVNLDGVNPREVRINLRVSDLELHQIDVRDVSRIIKGSNFDQSLGKITPGDNRYTVRVVGTLTSIDEISNLLLRSDGLRLSDVAEVVYEEPPLDYGRHLDGHFAIGVSITAESRANTVEVCRALEERIAAMKDDEELTGVNFLVWLSQGEEIKSTLKDLAFTGIFGSLLASLVLFVFLRRFSTTLVAVSCIPFSLIVTCGIVWMNGKSLNTLTLLGLIVGIGMLVDNAVVVMENIFRFQEQGMDRKKAAHRGSREVTTAVVAATLTSIIVFLPIIFNKPSEMNIYVKELGITVCLTLLASLFISQTLIPMAVSWFIKSKPRPRSRWMIWLEEHYTTMLAFNLRRRWVAPVTGLIVFASAYFPFKNVDMNFEASNAEMFVQVRYRFSEETSFAAKEDVVSQVEQALEPFRDEMKARSIYSFWGHSMAMTRIYLDKGEASEENLTLARAVLRENLPEIAGVRLRVQDTGHSWRRHRGGGRRVSFQLVGKDSEVLNELAEEAVERLEGIPGLVDAQAFGDDVEQELHILPDRDLSARYSISPFEVADVVGLTYRGRRLQRFRTPEGEREMRLTLDEQETETLSQLYNLPLVTSDEEKIPLAAVADFVQVPGAHRIERDNRQTSAWVGASYETGNREDYIEKVNLAMNGMEFPFGYSWTFGRWGDQQRDSMQEFLSNLFLALLMIFVVMASLFESVRQAIALMVALPFALAGAMWTLYFTHTDFDKTAAIGVLILIGIVVNNGIVMLEHINQYRRAGMDRTEAMLKGGRERLRPILMTAVTTFIGLMPIVIQRSSLGGVYYYSLALVIAGGLLISTFLTTVLLPTSAALSEDFFALIGRGITRGGRSVGRLIGRGRV